MVAIPARALLRRAELPTHLRPGFFQRITSTGVSLPIRSPLSKMATHPIPHRLSKATIVSPT